ncbi:helix-turn-helix transcriptional regulator [Paenibacillus sp. M1]|uniref:Helix-turn-helix transcriptional regulator n=1 Tax=Paenibacillus haidiansis TaxID=1574488 RepID=A0ABU7VMU7_9BACL
MKDIFFAENLKRFREAKGLTKEELGSRIGVTGATVGLWESKKNEPRMGKVQLIAGVLDVGVDDLLFSEPPTEQGKLPNMDELSEIKKRGIKAILEMSDDDLELIVQLMEKNLK